LRRIRIIKAAIWAAALYPAAALVYGFFTDNLSANPIDYITDHTGDWAITYLVVSLAVTPLRRVTGWNEVIKLRRLLGLFAFFYASLHLFTWVVLDKFFDWTWMVKDIFERKFITIGMAAFVILLALAVTSTTSSIRRLGRRWAQLHSLVYVAAILAVVHFWWLVKADVTLPRRWTIALVVLFGIRIWWALKKRRRLSF
jgi:sulfoxide reductase heme-binding subunit YedZ